MKNLTVAALLCIVALATISCGKDEDKAPSKGNAAFYGTWKGFEYPDYYELLTIANNGDKLTWDTYSRNDNVWESSGYTMENLTWEAHDYPGGHTTYPRGYIITGTVTRVYNHSGPMIAGEDDNGHAAVGERGFVCWYISADGKKLASGSYWVEGWGFYNPAEIDRQGFEKQ